MKTGFLESLPPVDARRGVATASVVIAYHGNADGSVSIRPTSRGFHLKLKGEVTIPFDTYAVRPFSLKDPLIEARWALAKCGWTPVAGA